MSGFDAGTFGGGIGNAASVSVDVYTAAYRVSGSIETRFSRITEILNQMSGAHLEVKRATISEYDDASATIAAPSALVSVEEILMMVAGELTGASGEMRVPKRPVRAQLAIPPFRITGTVHIPIGSRPVDGLLLGSDQFMAVTDATITSGSHPELERTAPVLAVRRRRAHVLLVADDENPDQLLADVLDERTAEAWLRPDTEGG
jgi:uncharacterized protein DUF6812